MGHILNGFDDFTWVDFARECSQFYPKLSVLDLYVVSLIYESVNKSDCITRAKTCAVVRRRRTFGVAEANNLLEKSTA